MKTEKPSTPRSARYSTGVRPRWKPSGPKYARPGRGRILKEPEVCFPLFIQPYGVQVGEERHAHLFVGQVQKGFKTPALQLEMRLFFLSGVLTKVDHAVPEAVAVLQ